MRDSPKDNFRAVRGSCAEVRRRARALRRRATAEEEKLWQALRGKRLQGLKFRRQHPMGPWILDFYCPAVRLAVEIDGPVHQKIAEQDAAREEQIKSYGICVVRFSNDEVRNRFAWVLNSIERAALGE